MPLNLATPILIVDDHKMMLQVVRSLTQQIGFTDIDESSSGQDAIEKLRRRDYGLVICDWNMTPLSGLDVLRAMQDSDGHRQIPFIMITAHAQESKVVEARTAGAASFIVKPFSLKTLQMKIQQCISA